MCHDSPDESGDLRFAVAAIVLEIFLGVGVVGGGLALMAGPNGEILPIPVSVLSGSPCANYLVPGAILFTILGIGPLGAAVLAWRRHPVAPLLTFAVGGALLIWLIVEIVIVGYSNDPPLQAWYLGLAGAQPDGMQRRPYADGVAPRGS